ncbi:MAG: FAD-dependent oxidoreductase, partial [Chloroflexi bacterium]|nr:FAD-dependent oxidoreductase [Chloroflexota bacterium]
GRDVNAFNIWGFRHRLAKAGVKILLNTKPESIGADGVAVVTDGNKQTLKADTVVLATGMEADKSLLEELGHMAEVEEIQSVGDCVAPRKAYNAVHDGFRIAVNI